MNQSESKKEKIRKYIERRQAERRNGQRSQIEDIEQIRRELGWNLVDHRQRDRRKK